MGTKLCNIVISWPARDYDSQEAKQPYFSGVFVQPPSFHLINHKSNEKCLFKSTSMLLERFKNCHLQMLTVVKFREFSQSTYKTTSGMTLKLKIHDIENGY